MLSEQSLSTSTILLIEADPYLRRLMTLGLQHNGMHVVESCSLRISCFNDGPIFRFGCTRC